MTRPAPRIPWYRDRRRRDRVTVYGFAVFGIGGVLLAGVLQFAEGDQRQVVATLQRDVTLTPDALAERRQVLKDDCGDLPGVALVPDRGDPDVQWRLPVRFSVAGTTGVQRAALEACLAEHGDIVRGIRIEGEA